MKYDLHIHTCLSPCADDDVTPAAAVGMARLAGAQLVAITDHNSALNLPAAEKAARAYGVRLLPGLEMTTEEELHLLCYFPSVKAALEMGRRIYEALPELPYDPEIWGRQIVMDQEDRELYTVEKLLTAATGIDIYKAKALCESFGGIAVPAHADKDSASLLSVLGFCPEDLDFGVCELVRPEGYQALADKGFLPSGMEVLHSSDAHSLSQVGAALGSLREDSLLLKLLGADSE